MDWHMLRNLIACDRTTAFFYLGYYRDIKQWVTNLTHPLVWKYLSECLQDCPIELDDKHTEDLIRGLFSFYPFSPNLQMWFSLPFKIPLSKLVLMHNVPEEDWCILMDLFFIFYKREALEWLVDHHDTYPHRNMVLQAIQFGTGYCLFGFPFAMRNLSQQ